MFDDENGTYYPIEDVSLYQCKKVDGKYDLFNCNDYSKEKENDWAKPYNASGIGGGDSSTSTPTDTTITPDKKLPQTGEKIAIVGTIGIVAVIAVILGIKAKKYNF